MTSPESVDRLWGRVCDDVLAGLFHALNNRLAAVGSIARVLEYGDPDGRLLTSLIAETESLGQTISLLSLLPRTEHDEIEPLRLADLVPDVLDLQRLRRETHDLEIIYTSDPGAPPGRADPVTLTRALLLALGPVSRAVLRHDGPRVVLEDAGGDHAILRLTAPDGVELVRGDGEMDAATRLMASTGGSLVFVDGPGGGVAAIELRMPLA